MSTILTIATYIATPMALLAFVGALGYFAYVRRVKFEEKKIQALPKEERALRTDEYLTRYGIDGKKLPIEDKLSLIRDEMAKRHKLAMSYVLVAASVFVICFALSVVGYVMTTDPNDDPPVKPDNKLSLNLANPGSSAWRLLSQATTFLRSEYPSYPTMEETIPVVKDLARNHQGYFFRSQPIPSSFEESTLIVEGIPDQEPMPILDVYLFAPKGEMDPRIRASTNQFPEGKGVLQLQGKVPTGSIVFLLYRVEKEGPELALPSLKIMLHAEGTL